MSPRTEAIEAEGWRSERWCRESLNAATCLQETGMGFCSVGSRIVLPEHLVADDQVESVFCSIEYLQLDSISDKGTSLAFDKCHRFLSSPNPGGDGDGALVHMATAH